MDYPDQRGYNGSMVSGSTLPQTSHKRAVATHIQPNHTEIDLMTDSHLLVLTWVYQDDQRRDGDPYYNSGNPQQDSFHGDTYVNDQRQQYSPRFWPISRRCLPLVASMTTAADTQMINMAAERTIATMLGQIIAMEMTTLMVNSSVVTPTGTIKVRVRHADTQTIHPKNSHMVTQDGSLWRWPLWWSARRKPVPENHHLMVDTEILP